MKVQVWEWYSAVIVVKGDWPEVRSSLHVQQNVLESNTRLNPSVQPAFDFCYPGFEESFKDYVAAFRKNLMGIKRPDIFPIFWRNSLSVSFKYRMDHNNRESQALLRVDNDISRRKNKIDLFFEEGVTDLGENVYLDLKDALEARNVDYKISKQLKPTKYRYITLF